MRQFGIVLMAILSVGCSVKPTNEKVAVIEAQLRKANTYWQSNKPAEVNAFWDNAAYHTGNMAMYELIGDTSFLNYTIRWAEHNNYQGATSTNKEEWKHYPYGEGQDFVLFGDWQICFQTYLDLYRLGKVGKEGVARAEEVMSYEVSTERNDYWWWADGLYMVMPVMTKMYLYSGDGVYLEKLDQYLAYSDSIMYDSEAGLYYRDAKYVYPKHKSVNEKKDFWARGDGWVFAAYAKILSDMPDDWKYRAKYEARYRDMAKAIKACQQEEGHWTRSLLDAEHAPGYETSGTAFFTFGFYWGINNGYLTAEEYLPVAEKGWNYLSTVALQQDGRIGYVQPIGERAIPGQTVNANSTANFGVGAFLLAGTEAIRYYSQK